MIKAKKEINKISTADFWAYKTLLADKFEPISKTEKALGIMAHDKQNWRII